MDIIMTPSEWFLLYLCGCATLGIVLKSLQLFGSPNK